MAKKFKQYNGISFSLPDHTQSLSSEATVGHSFLNIQPESFSEYTNIYTHKHIPPFNIDAFLTKTPLN